MVQPSSILSTAIIVDAMVLVQELSGRSATIKTCQELANQFILLVNKKTSNYARLHVIFDNYSFSESLKTATRDKRKGTLHSREYVCCDTTPISNSLQRFLSNTKTKDSLTVYLGNKVLEAYTDSLKTCIVSTKDGAMCNHGDVSYLSTNQEEADTIIILHAVDAALVSNTVHMLSPDTDVFVLALRRLPDIGLSTCVINAIGSKAKLVALKQRSR